MAIETLTPNPNPTKKQSLPKTLDTLSPEVLQEILSRLPLASLFQSRSVCPYFRSLVNGPRFSNLHHTHWSKSVNPTSLLLCTSTDDLYYIPDFEACEKAVKLEKLPFRSVLPTFEIVGSCNGLVCLAYTENKFNAVVVCNPVTGHWMKLPNPSNSRSGTILFGFGYNRDKKEYKLIRMQYDLDIRMRVEILTLGSGSWRAIGTTDISLSWARPEGVFVQGCLHWFVLDMNGKVLGIRTFNVEDECWGAISVPDSVKGKINAIHAWLGVLRGRLVMVDCSREDYEQVWVMTDYRVGESWVVGFAIPIAKFKLLKPLGVRKNGSILLECDGKILGSYDTKTRKLGGVKVHGLPHSFKAISHVGSLVTLKDAIGKEGD